jgi:hypothetical protein
VQCTTATVGLNRTTGSPGYVSSKLAGFASRHARHHLGLVLAPTDRGPSVWSVGHRDRRVMVPELLLLELELVLQAHHGHAVQ